MTALADVKRRLPSLEKMIEAYSKKAWYTIPPARGVRGVDPNAPREPSFFGPQVRLAARVVDEMGGGHPANLGECDCGDCPCDVRDGRGHHVPCWHDETCPHTGAVDEEAVSPRLYALVANHPQLREAFDAGLDAVYSLAGLTVAEAEVARYQHSGMSRSSIARVTGRADGTVNALVARVHKKLRVLAIEMEAAA